MSRSDGGFGCGVLVLIISALGIMAAIFMSKELNQLINWLFLR